MKHRQVLKQADELLELTRQAIDPLVERLNVDVLTNGRRADYQISAPDTLHWFRWQIGEVAHQCQYFADMDAYHKWVRLRIREESNGHSEVVVSVHALGRPFAGVMAVNGYFARREPGEDGRSDTGLPAPLSKAPFSFAYTENAVDVRRRFRNWLDDALAVGLEEWRRQL